MKKNITFIFFFLAGSGISIAQTTVVLQKKITEPVTTEETKSAADPDSVQVILSTSKYQWVETIHPVSNESKEPEANPEKVVQITNTRKPE